MGFFGNVACSYPLKLRQLTGSSVYHSLRSLGVGMRRCFVKHAKKIIIDVNTSIPLKSGSMHDIYIPAIPPNRHLEIPIYHAGDRMR